MQTSQSSHVTRQQIKNLPFPERAVAVSLKSIFDQIKKLSLQEEKEIQQNHLNFLNQFKILQTKNAEIIRGKPLSPADLKGSEKYLTPSEEAEVQTFKVHPTKLKDYWHTVVTCFYAQNLTEFDKSILLGIESIESAVTNESINLVITFHENKVIKAGSYTRKLILENGSPVKYIGDEIQWLADKQTGLISDFLLEIAQTSEQATNILELVNEFVNQIIPYSLEYFLGVNEGNDEDNENGEDDEDEDDEDADEENSTSKKVKP